MGKEAVKFVERAHRADAAPAQAGGKRLSGHFCRVLVRQCVEGAALAVLAARDGQEFRVHRAGAGGEHVDAAGAQLFAQRAGKALHIGLCGAVDGHARRRRKRRDRRDIEDQAARRHVGQAAARHGGQRTAVQVDHAGLVAGLAFGKIAEPAEARVVDEQRQRGLFLFEQALQRPDGGGVGQVERHGAQRFAGELRGKRFEALAAACNEPERVDIGTELDGGAEKLHAEAGGRAGDDGGFHRAFLL